MPESKPAVCARCKGTAIDPEHSGTENYGDGIVRPVPEPCADCQFTCPGWPECPSPGSCPGCTAPATPAP